ncbi:MAG TPA: LysR family transcriptional regulator [Rhizomicrobium sp.]|nr:LysR family transcriptional regulator [Rhizomicrobium sp.]
MARAKALPADGNRRQDATMAGLFLRLPIGDSGNVGPGKARLLELIDETGSIRSAAAKMKLSYRRAWLLLQDLERVFGGPVLERRTGGKSGGGAALNARGRDVVKYFRNAERRAARAIKADLDALTKLKS